MSTASKGRYRENLVKEKFLNSNWIVVRASASKSFLPVQIEADLKYTFGDFPKPDLAVFHINKQGNIDKITKLIAVVDGKSFSVTKCKKVVDYFNEFSNWWEYQVWIYKGHKKFEIID